MSQLELNKGDNFIFGVDVSASMQTRDLPGGVARIDGLKEAVITFAKEAGKYDDDGIDVIAYGQKLTVHKGVTAEKASDIIGGLRATESMTNTHLLVREAYKLHKTGGYKQTVLFVATDGAPSEPDFLKEEIRIVAADIRDEHEFAISFLTVGEIDPSLAAFLAELDDGLKAKHDIVDVKALAEVDFLTAFSGALHD